MSNSPLISHTAISPFKSSPRSHVIDTITIHCFVGQWTIERMGSEFSVPNKNASSNYGIDKNGRIGLFVDENDRSWCSSNWRNDDRAITIECASDTKDPYAINDKVYQSLVRLCADICKRNGIKELKWKGDKSLIGQVDKQNMTVHRWFAAKACPGDYIYNRLGQIAAEVNAMLSKGLPEQKLYRVQTGAFKDRTYADRHYYMIKTLGYEAYMVKVNDYYKIQVGAFANRNNAEALVRKLKDDNVGCFITTEKGEPVH